MGSEPVAVRSIVRELRLHPRVAYQGLYTAADAHARLLAGVPDLAPFRGAYRAALAIVDWDHRLPSRRLVLRLYAYYDAAGLAAGASALDERFQDIGRRDRFPEFDVPDFADLPADEAYEAELAADGAALRCRLTSAWRREVQADAAARAVAVARTSEEFRRVAATAADRPRHLGDLEAVGWTPPCETGHAGWTVDVWYLLAFDGRLGSGRSLLVDVETGGVAATRDFSVRTG